MKSLGFLYFAIKSLETPPPLFFLWHPSAPLLLTAAGAEHLPAAAELPAAAPPPAAILPTHHLDVGRRPSPPLLSFFARATTTRASAGRHIVAAVFRARICFSSLPLMSRSTSRQPGPICTSFSPCRAHPSPITTAAPLLPSGELLAAVDSRR
jgi:hypothetical protein